MNNARTDIPIIVRDVNGFAFWWLASGQNIR